MPKYVTGGDVLAWGGETALVFGDYDPTHQNALIDQAEAMVDRLTRQDGGLQQQTGKTVTLSPAWSSDGLVLPNRPVTAVSSIVVTRAGVALAAYPVSSRVMLIDGYRLHYVPLLADAIALPPFQVGDLIAVTYACGYGTGQLPASVVRATLLLLGYTLFQMYENPRLGEQTAAEGDSIRYLSQFEAEAMASQLLADVTVPKGATPRLVTV